MPWRFQIDMLKALRLTRSLLDRCFGMASLHLDTAGASALSSPLRIRYLPVNTSQAIYARLSADIARRPLRW